MPHESNIGSLPSRSVLRNLPRLPFVSNRCDHNPDAPAAENQYEETAHSLRVNSIEQYTDKTHIPHFPKFAVKLNMRSNFISICLYFDKLIKQNSFIQRFELKMLITCVTYISTR